MKLDEKRLYTEEDKLMKYIETNGGERYEGQPAAADHCGRSASGAEPAGGGPGTGDEPHQRASPLAAGPQPAEDSLDWPI